MSIFDLDSNKERSVDKIIIMVFNIYQNNMCIQKLKLLVTLTDTKFF